MKQDKSERFDLITKRILFSHAHMIERYMQVFNRYKNFKNRIKDENLKNALNVFDQFFYDETGKFNWENISQLLPADIENSIKKEYNTLNDKEIRLCCLLLLDLSVSDIAEILQYTQKSVHTITYNIKQKTGIKDIKIAIENVWLRENILKS